MGGLLPMMMAKDYKKQQAEEAKAKEEAEALKAEQAAYANSTGAQPMKKGGSASARADGIAQRGKTRGKMY